ncbi:MAG: ATP-binding cassette domain-containing protein [Spirulina sp. DLM2.Bin59]|nr:MAG: ATP-binding cassette domain-containing protein [Spirulina sp. DLM2.Bin59]
MAHFLEVEGLQKYFPIGKNLLGRPKQVVKAVEQVSFAAERGKTLGIVGESGCGKSTTARLLMDLISPDAGRITLDGETYGKGRDRKPIRELRKRMQMVFQDSYASLNARLTIEESIAFGPKIHGVSESAARAKARDLLDRVGLAPDNFIRRYPHELSGGQRQRVNIARALAIDPEIVILDEAVSALDKSVQAQVLNLLADLKADYGLTYLFISHDLNVVQYVSDTVIVMYLGQVVESGPAHSLYANPAHPYTAALLSALPALHPEDRKTHAPLEGDPPNPISPPSGCRFHPRCPYAEAVCGEKMPPLTDLGAGRHVACHMRIEGSGYSEPRPLAAPTATPTTP